MGYPQLIDEDSDEELDIGMPGGALALAGEAESTYETDPGSIDTDESKFRFLGTNQVFSGYLGASTRAITWKGDLRCSSNALAALRLVRDKWQKLPGTVTFIDDDGTPYPACRIKSKDGFVIGKKRRMQTRGNLEWVVPYSIELEQLEP